MQLTSSASLDRNAAIVCDEDEISLRSLEAMSGSIQRTSSDVSQRVASPSHQHAAASRQMFALGSYHQHLASSSTDALLSDLRSHDFYADKTLAACFLHIVGDGDGDEDEGQKSSMIIGKGHTIISAGLSDTNKTRSGARNGGSSMSSAVAAFNAPAGQSILSALKLREDSATPPTPSSAVADVPMFHYAPSSSAPANISSRSPPPRDRIIKDKKGSGSSANTAGKTMARSTSTFRGVTRHRWTGRFEAHLWDSSVIRVRKNNKGRRKGKQVYLGGWSSEEEAARAYDRAALRFWGQSATLNFSPDDYVDEVEKLMSMTKEEMVASLRRRSSGFSRGASKFRGVTKHHMHGKWEARIGRVAGNRYLYLGTFNSEGEAARAYDRAALRYRGQKAVTNYSVADYDDTMKDADTGGDLFLSTAAGGATHTAAPDAAATGPVALGEDQPADHAAGEACDLRAQLSASLLAVLEDSHPREFFIAPLDLISPKSDASAASNADFLDLMLP